MSKIVEDIKALRLNERRISDWVDTRSSFSVNNDDFRMGAPSIDVMHLYDVKVTLGSRVAVDVHNAEHLGTMVDNVKRAVIEELYGEFRKSLIALEINISEGNRQKSLELVRDIQADMFGMIRLEEHFRIKDEDA